MSNATTGIRDKGPRLEVLSRGKGVPGRAPLLLVHGAWHGAWCWDMGFMDRLASAGHEVHALSLRGHGGSEGRDRLRTTRVRDYVDDVARVAGSLRAPPILVGHSMGAFVIQKYLESHDAPGAALLAPMPHFGIAPLTLRLARQDPVAVLLSNLTMRLTHVVATPERAHRLFFSPDMPAAEVAGHHARLQDEAFLAYLDMLVLDLCKPSRVSTPLLVLGASHDAIFPPEQVESLAAAHGVRAEMVEGMAHDMMLERGWEAVADRVSAFAAAVADNRGQYSMVA